MNEMQLAVESGRDASVIKLLHKGNSRQLFMSHPSNFFAQGLLFGQSRRNPEGTSLSARVLFTRQWQGNAGEL
jgi:hypothetical protein